jgi:hypothetical protein
MSKELAEVLREVLISPNVVDSNFEAANLVDTTDRIASALWAIAQALHRIADTMGQDDQRDTGGR